MKKILLVLIPALILFSCKDSNKGGFTVSGTISDAAGQQLVLNGYSSAETVHLDTVVLDETGAYEFSASASNPELYGLQLGEQQAQLLFIADSLDAIIINADGNDYRGSYTIEGSEHSTLLKQLYDQLDAEYLKIDELNRQYISKQGTVDQDSLNRAVGMEFQNIVNNHKKFSKKFIDDNLSSPAIVLALYQQFGPNAPVFSLNDDRDYFEKVQTSLSQLYPNSSLVIGIQQTLESNPPVPGIGKYAPDIKLPNPEGKEIALSSFRGQYVLLDFWAAWCRPCRLENPTVVKNYNKYKKDKFTIFQVSLDKEKEDWVKAIKDDGLEDWTHVSDLKYWQSEAAELYGVRGIPANFLIDPEGKIVAINLRGPDLGLKLSEIFGH